MKVKVVVMTLMVMKKVKVVVVMTLVVMKKAEVVVMTRS